MTSENELRKIAADEVREAVARYTPLWENHPHPYSKSLYVWMTLACIPTIYGALTI